MASTVDIRILVTKLVLFSEFRYENQVELNEMYETSIEEMKLQRKKLEHWTELLADVDDANLKKAVTDLKRQKIALESKRTTLARVLLSFSSHFHKK